jgi:hypothetical protein
MPAQFVDLKKTKIVAGIGGSPFYVDDGFLDITVLYAPEDSKSIVAE